MIGENIIDIDFVEQYLYCHYQTYYTNPNYREDLVGEAILEICENITDFDSEKAGFKAWATPHIKRGALKFLMSIHELSEYYIKLRAKAYKVISLAAEKGVELTLHDVLSEKAANAISHSSVRLTSVMENTISTTLEDTIIVEETLNELSKIMDFLSEEEREIIKAKAEACSKKDFLVKMRNLGYKKGSERDIYNKVSAKAQKYAYQNGLVKCITA